MTTLLKECVQAKTNETRWMVGGTNHGKMAGAAESGAQEAGDVPVQDAPERALPGLSEGLCGTVRVVRSMVTRQASPWSEAGSDVLPVYRDLRQLQKVNWGVF